MPAWTVPSRNRRPRARGAGLALLLLLATAAGAARADSLWDRRVRSAAFLYQDLAAADVGDSLTIVIADESAFSKKAARDLSKDATHTADISATYTVSDVLKKVILTPLKLGASVLRKFSASNKYTGEREFSDTVTVTVVDRLPNGNLVVAGRSERTVEGEDVVTVVTGVVRPQDIGSENSIRSERVAELRLFYETSGGAGDAFMHLGPLNRLLNVLWPF